MRERGAEGELSVFGPKKEEAVEETEAAITTVMAEKTEESTTLEAVIFVDIKGEVKKPGVYQMKVGDRVKDAIDAAALDRATSVYFVFSHPQVPRMRARSHEVSKCSVIPQKFAVLAT